MAKNLIKGDSSIVDLNTGYDGLELDISKFSIGDKFCISFNFDANYNRANEKTEIVIFEIDYIRCIVATPTSGTYSAVIEVKPYEIADNSLKLFVMGAGDGEDQYCTITNVMLVKGDQPAEWKPWSDISEYKYTLKKVEKSNSKNLIVGDTKEVFVEGTVLFKIQGPITKGDKIVINGKYSELFDGEIYIIINDGNTNRFDQLFYDDEIFVGFPFILNAKRDSIGDITLEITTLIESVILENLMLNEGDTPLPWENNLGDQEITIREIRKNNPSKNLIVGDTSEVIITGGIEFDISIQNFNVNDTFILIAEYESLPNTVSASYRLTGESTGSIPSKIGDSWEARTSSIKNPKLQINITDFDEGGGYLKPVKFKNLMLVPGDIPLPWENNINPEVSLSPIYKNDEKVWEKTQQIKYKIIEWSKSNYKDSGIVQVNYKWLKSIAPLTSSYEYITEGLWEFITELMDINNISDYRDYLSIKGDGFNVIYSSPGQISFKYTTYTFTEKDNTKFIELKVSIEDRS